MAMQPNVQVQAVKHKLYYSTTENGTYTDLFGVVNITPPGVTNAEISVTNASSSVAEFIPGTPEITPVVVKIQYNQANPDHAALYDAAIAGTKLFWKIAYPKLEDKYAVPFSGFVKDWTPQSLEQGKILEVDFNIRLQSVPAKPAVDSSLGSGS